jgi:hypothetical protein
MAVTLCDVMMCLAVTLCAIRVSALVSCGGNQAFSTNLRATLVVEIRSLVVEIRSGNQVSCGGNQAFSTNLRATLQPNCVVGLPERTEEVA